MTQPLARNRMNGWSAAVDFLVGRLIGIAAGPELRVSYAIAQAAKRARRRQSGLDATAPSSTAKRSGKW
jgi:hypothetical protein